MRTVRSSPTSNSLMRIAARFPGSILVVVLLVLSQHGQTPSVIERRILGHLDNISKFGNYGGEYDENKIDSENRALRELLIKSGKRADVLRYGFPKLKGEMRISTSPDGRLRIYSWDEQTGGTMHDHDSVFQYRGSSGKVLTWGSANEAEDIGAFFHDIFQLSTNNGPVYLAVSTFVGSTSLGSQSIEVMRIVGDKLDRNVKLIRTSKGLTNSIYFEYDFFSVVDRPERPVKLFTFDKANRSFSFPVVIEDEQTPQGRVTNKLITYRFNGSYFVKTN